MAAVVAVDVFVAVLGVGVGDDVVGLTHPAAITERNATSANVPARAVLFIVTPQVPFLYVDRTDRCAVLSLGRDLLDLRFCPLFMAVDKRREEGRRKRAGAADARASSHLLNLLAQLVYDGLSLFQLFKGRLGRAAHGARIVIGLLLEGLLLNRFVIDPPAHRTDPL